MTTPTTHYSWQKPINAGDNNAWGTELNTVLDSIDSQVFTNAGAALALAGGAMTGRIDEVTATAACVVHSSISGSLAIDLSLANYHAVGVTGTTTISFTNVPSPSASGSNVQVLAFRLVNAGSVSLTWPSSVKWPNGTQPTWTTGSKQDMLVLCSDDNGTTWRTVGYALDVR